VPAVERPFQHARAVLEQAVANGAIPGAVALVVDTEKTLASFVVGQAALEPEPKPLSRDTLYDLASLTKLFTIAATLVLVQRGYLALDDAASRTLPSLRSAGRDAIRLHHLLTHTAGLRAWYPLYTRVTAPEEAVSLIARLPLAAPPGTRPEYSDLGFILLGAVLQAAASQSLDDLMRESVLEPLGMRDTCFRPPSSVLDRIAPTERDHAYEAGMVRRLGLVFHGFPPGVAHGRVHDGNAAYAMGGVSGHAGLFGTAEDLGRFAQMWLRRGEPLLHQRCVAAATRSWTEHLGERRGLGWALYRPGPLDLRTDATRSGGDLLGPRAFGHTGFTGTSLWIDPDLDLAVILLSNRVHPTATPDHFGRVRAQFHNAIIADLPERRHPASAWADP
jgi:CubicO group peptidase (beta-lactamase class C family)